MAFTRLKALALAITTAIHPHQLYTWIQKVTDVLDAQDEGAVFNTVRLGALGSGRLIDIEAAQLAVLTNGDSVWTISLKSAYRWDPLSTLADDATGNTVVQPLAITGSNPGRFIRDTDADPEWAVVATWHVDAVNGNNENDGTLLPLADGLELGRRWGTGTVINQQTTVFLDSPGQIPCAWDIKLGNAGALWVTGNTTGGKTIITTGTVSSFTAVVTTYNSAAKAITATSGTSFAALAGKRMRNTTAGARLDARAWVDADNGGNSCLSTTWLQPAANRFTGSSIPTRQPPSANDTIEVYSVPTITKGPLIVNPVQGNVGGTTDSARGFILEDVDIGVNSPTQRVFVSTSPDLKTIYTISANWIRARIFGAQNGLANISPQWTNLQLFNSTFYVYGGNSPAGSSLSLATASYVAGDFDHYKEGAWTFPSTAAGLDAGNTIAVGNLADFSSQGLVQTYGNFLVLGPFVDGATGLLWGTSTATNGISVNAGCTAYIKTTRPTIKAATNDFLLGADTALNNARAYDETGVAYTAPITSSWAQWATSVAGGGFAGNAHNLSADSHLIKGS